MSLVEKKVGRGTKFTYEELAFLNRIIGNALMSGQVEFNEVSESVHKKVAEEICRLNAEEK